MYCYTNRFLQICLVTQWSIFSENNIFEYGVINEQSHKHLILDAKLKAFMMACLTFQTTMENRCLRTLNNSHNLTISDISDRMHLQISHFLRVCCFCFNLRHLWFTNIESASTAKCQSQRYLECKKIFA